MKRVLASILVGVCASSSGRVHALASLAQTKTFRVPPAIAYLQEAPKTRLQELQTVLISCNYPEKSPFYGAPNGEASLSVKVNENGEIIPSALQVLGTTYSDGSYDEMALFAVRKYSFPATGKAESYFVRVQFKNNRTPYSRCPVSLP